MLLLERGANTDVYDDRGCNALHIVMRYMPLLFDARALEEIYDILMMLVTSGADVYATNYWNETPSDVALDNGYRDIWIRVLWDCGYHAEAVLGYRKGSTTLRPTQRTRLSFKEYCQQRASSTSFGCVEEASEMDVTNVQKGCSHGPHCKGPLCRLMVSSVSVDRYMCSSCDDDTTFCSNCKAFERLVQFNTSDGRCRNLNADATGRRDDEKGIDSCKGDKDEKNDTNTPSNGDFPAPSSIALKGLELEGMHGVTEDQDFMKLFINDEWE